uniref:Uncharacterized protein n=1 Tax=Craspedostauros australis TaxID=1486917 RepID=A0A6T6GU52_9STRA
MLSGQCKTTQVVSIVLQWELLLAFVLLGFGGDWCGGLALRSFLRRSRPSHSAECFSALDSLALPSDGHDAHPHASGVSVPSTQIANTNRGINCSGLLIIVLSTNAL